MGGPNDSSWSYVCSCTYCLCGGEIREGEREGGGNKRGGEKGLSFFLFCFLTSLFLR